MTDEEIIDEAREFLKRAISNESNNRIAALEDLEFGAGKQWPSDVEAQRMLERRPCLTVNKTDSLVRQVVNNMRQQRPRMVVHPVGNGADVDVAEVVQGLLRHVEVNSGADVAYDTAADFQVRMGWGYWRVTTRYTDDDSFEQDMYVDPVMNPFTVYWDPQSEQPDGSDAERCIVTDMVRRDSNKYKDVGDFGGRAAGDDDPEWSSEESVRVAEYWKVIRIDDELVRLSNGWKGFKSQAPLDTAQSLGHSIVDSRKTVRRTVMQYMLAGNKVVSKKLWPGKWIPIIPVYGATIRMNGRVTRYGMIRNLKDPARMYNFWRTSEAEIVALAPKAPWVMAEGQDEGHEAEWDQANTKSFSRLIYKPTSSDDGRPHAPPQRQQPQAIPAASVNAAMAAGEDMKAVAGIFDPSLGARESDPSGIALSRHQQQSDLSNFHFYDNYVRSVRHTGKILLDLMRTTYDTERATRIVGEDGNPKPVTINEKQKDANGAVEKVLNDVTIGTYDIVIDTGPGYQTKRQEAADSMVKLLGTPLGEKIAMQADDIVVRHFDWPGARDLADRLAAGNPLAQAESIPDLPEQAQAMVKGLQGQVKQLQGALQQAEQEIKLKQGIEQLKQDAETNREHMRLVTKAHDIDTVTATKRHDTETRALSAQNVAEIKAIADLLIKHIDGKHLETQIDAQDRQLQNKSDQTESV